MNLNDVHSHMMRKKELYLSEYELRVPMKQIVTALNAIHEAGFLHNDITPQSILLDKKEGR